MIRLPRNIIVLILLLLGTTFAAYTTCFAADTTYFVTDSGDGGADGKAIGTAWSFSDFLSSGNWDASDNADKIDPGDTV